MFVQRLGPSGEPEWVVVNDDDDEDDGAGTKSGGKDEVKELLVVELNWFSSMAFFFQPQPRPLFKKKNFNPQSPTSSAPPRTSTCSTTGHGQRPTPKL